jgi:hypothetical protein
MLQLDGSPHRWFGNSFSCFQNQPERFIFNTSHLSQGLNT